MFYSYFAGRLQQSFLHQTANVMGISRLLHMADSDGTLSCKMSYDANTSNNCHSGVKLEGESVKLNREGVKLDREGLNIEREGAKIAREGVKFEMEGARFNREGVNFRRDTVKLDRDGVKLDREFVKFDREFVEFERNAVKLDREDHVDEQYLPPCTNDYRLETIEQICSETSSSARLTRKILLY